MAEKAQTHPIPKTSCVATSNATNSDSEESKVETAESKSSFHTSIVIDCRDASTSKSQQKKVAPKWRAQSVNVPLEVLDEVDRLIKRFKKKK